MPDTLSHADRNRIMGRVKQRDTAPEVAVRRLLHAMGYRFRLHYRHLPGTPDIVMPRHRKVIFVHGCFWHGHNCARGARPSTNTEFWNAKLDRNIDRDARVQQSLRALGWDVLTVWQCQTRDQVQLEGYLDRFLHVAD